MCGKTKTTPTKNVSNSTVDLTGDSSDESSKTAATDSSKTAATDAFTPSFACLDGASQLILVLVGRPGSGKSLFANAFQNLPRKWTVVNQDILKTRGKCEKLTRAALKTNQSVVVDRTNIDQTQRLHWITIANERSHCKVVVLDFGQDMSKEQLLQNIQTREGHETLQGGRQAKMIVTMMTNKYRRPSYQEGIDMIEMMSSNLTERKAFAEKIKEWMGNQNVRGGSSSSGSSGKTSSSSFSSSSSSEKSQRTISAMFGQTASSTSSSSSSTSSSSSSGEKRTRKDSSNTSQKQKRSKTTIESLSKLHVCSSPMDNRLSSLTLNKKYVVLAMVEVDSTGLHSIEQCKAQAPDITNHMQFTNTLHFTLMKGISQQDAELFANAVVSKNHIVAMPQIPDMLELGQWKNWSAGMYVALAAQSKRALAPLLNWMEGIVGTGKIVTNSNLHMSLYRFRGRRNETKKRNMYDNGIEKIRQNVNVKGEVRVVRIVLKELSVDYESCVVVADCL